MCCSFFCQSLLVTQPGASPLHSKGYLLRHHILSASSLKNHVAGLMVAGPFWNFPIGEYQVHYYMRARAPHHFPTSTNNKMALPPGEVCTIAVQDASQSCGNGNSCRVLCSRVLPPSEFRTGNHWSRFMIELCIENPLNALDVQVLWHGNASLDIAVIAISASKERCGAS